MIVEGVDLRPAHAAGIGDPVGLFEAGEAVVVSAVGEDRV